MPCTPRVSRQLCSWVSRCWERPTFCQTLDPRAPWEAMACNMTDPAPADSPAMVTLVASPPNLEMCLCTQSKANAWSRRPALTTPLLLTSADERKPNAPNCGGCGGSSQQRGPRSESGRNHLTSGITDPILDGNGHEAIVVCVDDF